MMIIYNNKLSNIYDEMIILINKKCLIIFYYIMIMDK